MKLRRTVPAQVKAVRDRRLAWALTDDGVALVASPTCLWVGEEQVPWTAIEKAVWKPDVLTVHEMAEVQGTGATRSWTLVEDSRLAETIRERVTGSVGWSDRRKLSPEGHVRYVGRRVPGQELLTWQVVWDADTDPGNPFLRAQVEATLDGLKKTIG